jgi:aryl-alcohol dehydrogenase-like predicted oxidoreductase
MFEYAVVRAASQTLGDPSMQYTNLGRTALKVSRLCLGTMNFGPQTSEDDSHKIMDRALEHGINFFDTANVYGWAKGEGKTEQIIGNWFAKGGQRREKTVIATKVYGDMGDWPNESRLSALHIRRACDESLRRLKTDYIDLYQMHHVWRESSWEEIYQAFEVLVQKGKVLYFGSSNFAGWHVAQANEVAKRRNFLGLVSEQCKYSLLTRNAETDILPACQHYGMGVIPWSPLAGGALGGVLRKASEGRRAQEWVEKLVDEKRATFERYEALCKDLGENPADVGLAWLLANPIVTAPIIGPRTMEQLDGSLRAVELQLTDETKKQLDDIFPGHKTAPEDFAW